MNNTTQIYQAIGAVSEKVNDLSARLDSFIRAWNEAQQSDIDYIAMETGVDLDIDDDQEPKEVI